MSKISSELRLARIKILGLYKRILRSHYLYLTNPDMRVFGDYFVKSEFTLNYNNEDIAQIDKFLVR